VQSQFAYVNANLPVAMGVSMVYPRGLPPNRQTLRDYAELWNSTFDPDSVIEDLGNGEASPAQMRVLRDVHPDLYQQVHQEVLFAVGSAFSEIPTQRKQQLDILFESDGIAGPCFSWRASGYIDEANRAAAHGTVAALPRGRSVNGAAKAFPGAASLNAIRSGVTNRGA
jgi:hypothetical protein